MNNNDIWNSNVPSEQSPYLQDEEITYYNLDCVEIAPRNFYMIDLFCGAGGFSVGCEWAGFQPVFGVDHFKPAMATWVENHPHAIGCLGDVRKISPAEIHKLLLDRGINEISLLTGGVPCQGFSVANRKHNDNDERNFLFIEYMRFVKEFSPKVILLENVSGLRYTAGGSFEKNIIHSMEDLGYTVQVKLLNAADYGVPQYRSRLIFIGIKPELLDGKEFCFPSPLYSPEKYHTVSDALSDLPSIKAGEHAEEYLSPPKNEYQNLMRGVKNAINTNQQVYLTNHVAPNHPKSTVDMINNTKQGEPLYDKFQQKIRLSENKPSPTQLAGGIRPSFQFGHPTDARGLTTRERARIQSFPDCYKFKGGIVQERVQTGNAAPPLLVYVVAKEIYKILCGGSQ